jgi:putative heme-binding domain-containing protein
VLGSTTRGHAGPALLALVDPKHPQEVQAAAVAALEQLDEGAFAGEMLGRWSALSPRVRDAAAAAMVKRPARARALLAAIGDGTVRRADVSSAHSAALRQSADKAVKALAAKVFTAPTAGGRDALIKKFAPAIGLKGDATKGRQTYLAKCASCHRLAGEGNTLGPDLETVKNAGREKLLTSVLDPNGEVAPNFTAYVVDTVEGDSQSGVIASETPAAVTLRMAYGMEVAIPRADIKAMRSAGLSMMPEGLEEGMTPQDLADLLEYVEKGK